MSHKPSGFHTVTPYLIVDGCNRLLEFVQQAFDANVAYCTKRANGTIMHASFRIGDSVVECSDANSEFPARPASLHLYVEDADATYRKAIEAGAESLREPADQLYGDREGDVVDPCGNQWYIATHKEDISEDEIKSRMSGL